MGDRPRIGVSACLLGEPVRYDGRHKRDAWLVDTLGPQVEWIAVCPEVEAGFGTPRETMELVTQPDGAVALQTTESRRDVTDVMLKYAAQRVSQLAACDLDGYVLKADSPSCGLETPGLFASALMRRLPNLPVADERQLDDPAARARFVERVQAHHRTRSRAVGDSWRTVSVVRIGDGHSATVVDRAATEEPLEVRLHGRPFAVIMRTPGADRELAAGFLLAERVIACADDLGTIEHCVDADAAGQNAQNIVNVTLAHGSAKAVEHHLANRRQVTTTSSCGLCGRQTIDSLMTAVAPLTVSWRVPASRIARLPARLRERQTAFGETGGMHAAGLFTIDEELIDVAEDVGRHNAVDKIVGRRLMRDELPLDAHLLCVSGRTSFEIVQKALFAGIPLVAAVSAPSTLAIDLARESGLTLIGFVRGASFSIYTHPERIER